MEQVFVLSKRTKGGDETDRTDGRKKKRQTRIHTMLRYQIKSQKNQKGDGRRIKKKKKHRGRIPG